VTPEHHFSDSVWEPPLADGFWASGEAGIAGAQALSTRARNRTANLYSFIWFSFIRFR
jgi:hypothetical protein